MRKFYFTAGLIVLCLIVSSTQCLASTSEFDLGVSDFGKKEYKTALSHFDNAIKANPRDCNAIYYKALVLTRLGMSQQAQMQYGVLVRSFPGTEAARNAEIALATLNPRYLQMLKPSNPGASDIVQPAGTINGTADSGHLSDLDFASLPKRSRIYFENEGKHMLIDATINGRPLKMLFDSSAENVTFEKNQLAQLGIRPPETATGGDAAAPQISAMRVTLKVGEIERRNFPITVQDELLTRPLLGQTFLKAFQYEVDNAAKTITFTKKDSTAKASANDPNSIPFKREGNEVVVQVEVNGRTIPMFLDTGVEQIYFTADQARAVGLEIPDDAMSGTTATATGKRPVKYFNVQRIKCGPVIKNDVRVLVLQPTLDADIDPKVKKQDFRHPLLGQEFFGDFRITVDNDANVIRMRR